MERTDPSQPFAFRLLEADVNGEPCSPHPESVFHTVVVDPNAPEGAQRHSQENRFIAFVRADEAPKL